MGHSDSESVADGLRQCEEQTVHSIVRKQLPLRPALTFTLDKAQALTLEQMVLYWRKPVFTHDQFYVALSRCGKRSNVKVMVVSGRSEDREGGFTRNIVYRSALI